jgi:hypothetical protein
VSVRERLEAERLEWPDFCTATDAAIAAAEELCAGVPGWVAVASPEPDFCGLEAERLIGVRNGVLGADIRRDGVVDVFVDVTNPELWIIASGTVGEAVAFIRGMEAP